MEVGVLCAGCALWLDLTGLFGDVGYVYTLESSQ